jgi:hypothetical protein
MKKLVETGANAENINAAIFESMINKSSMSADDMKLVLENHNVHQSISRLEHNRELVTMIDILLGGLSKFKYTVI